MGFGPGLLDLNLGSSNTSSTAGVHNVIRYAGEANVPQDVLRLRKNSLETMRRLGTPVVVKHMYNNDDVLAGVAKPSPNFDDVYKQPRHHDPISNGVGFVSIETSPDEWVAPNGTLFKGDTPPDASYIPAPRYRGYGPGYLTYVIFPDVATDFFKVAETGVFIKVQTAQVQMGWYPEVNDNDLLILVEIDRNENIVTSHERYQLKMTNPVSVRGLDRKGRREYTEDFGNRHVVNQSFELTLAPPTEPVYNVEIDR